ncbi:aspartyl protease family protein [Sphingomonas sp.]|uniref:aspartyl protease family protein n=1 Tax=Sphingomonas sp. TaxID=28214 RepID=UPI0025FB041F|nr:aspartyl protease family protein [Sphingomonas sp.]MBV9528282.1 aspartyl protease family protein [Sphingomonas sp.]
MRRRALSIASGLLLATLAVGGSAQAPHIDRPRPAPPTAPNVPRLPPAVFDGQLAIGGKDVKAREIDTRLDVGVFINGRGPYHFVVDSGADSSAVGLRIAHDLQLPLGTPVIINGMTSRDLVDRVKLNQLTVGSTTVNDLEVPALRESDLGGDGLIGIDALVQQRLMMDFDTHTIRVEDARIPERIDPYLPGEIVVVAKRRRGQLILTQVRADRYQLDAVIDTGSEITIGNLALRDKLIRRGAKFWTVQAIGVTGVRVNLELARVDELQLGPVLLSDVPIAFADVPPFKLFGLSNGPALLLGTDILQSFRRVSLDFRSRRIRFQLKRCRDQGIVINTAPVDMFTHLSSTEHQGVCDNS